MTVSHGFATAERYSDRVRGNGHGSGLQPSSIRDELEKIEANVAIQLAAASPPEAAADVYASVRFALSQRHALRCEYESIAVSGKKPDGKNGKASIFHFKPYALFFGQ